MYYFFYIFSTFHLYSQGRSSRSLLLVSDSSLVPRLSRSLLPRRPLLWYCGRSEGCVRQGNRLYKVSRFDTVSTCLFDKKERRRLPVA